jgi:Tfp pilus assembly protein PilF
LWGYGIVSLGHWLDMLNQIFLAAAGGIFLLLGLVLKRAKIKFDATNKFLSLAAAGGFLFLLVIDPKLGTARDWDLLAWSGIPVALWFLYWLRQNRPLHGMLGIGGVLSVWLFVPWLGVNSSEVRAVKRYEDLLIKDPRSAAYGYENLAIYYRDKGNRAGEEQTYRKSVEAEPGNPRFLYNYALALAKNGQYQQSLYYYQSSLQIDPGRSKRWNDYGAALINAGRSREAAEALVKSVSLEQGNADAWYNLGIARVLLKSWAPADSAFEMADKFGFSQPWLYAYWGRVKLQRGFYFQSVILLGTALERGIQDAEVSRDYEAARAAAGGGHQQAKELGR